ncbi:MAG: alpha-galactosidase [Candidatus Marinimicrobia bacterium]|nr:alpha-galactosidase [Candidatus Neomarinimicrobiota bacterium]
MGLQDERQVMAKVVIIGAGSFVFSSRMQADVLSYPELADTEFVLVDIDPVRLDYARQIAERILREGGYQQARVSATLDRRQALAGADYVIICILVGGYAAIEPEIDIPMKYGVDQCIGDTLTPGGIMRCLRTLPVLEEIGRDVSDLCPQALVLNYTNPMSMLSWGFLDAFPHLAYVGLCHSVQGTVGEWCRRLDVPRAEVNFTCAGINHQAWLLRFERHGEDLLPRIRALACDPAIWSGDSTRMEYLKHFGYPVTESSGHGSEYNWWFRKNKTTRARYCDSGGSKWNGASGFIKELYARPDWEEEMRAKAQGTQPMELKRSVEYGSQIIHAHHSGQAQLIYGNVRNDGLIDNLPAAAVVEVAIHVDRNGLQPLRYGPLPPHLAALNRAQISVQELAVRAVQERDPERVFQALAFDPLTAMACTLDEIRALGRELLEAHQQWLPFPAPLPDKPLMYTRKSSDAEAHQDPGLDG